MAITTSTTETCDGKCSDSDYWHNHHDGDGKSCPPECRNNRFEGRCHCGRKYAEPEAEHSPEATREALWIVNETDKARYTLALEISMDVERVAISLHSVPPLVWAALPMKVDPAMADRKRFQASTRDVGISYWRGV